MVDYSHSSSQKNPILIVDPQLLKQLGSFFKDSANRFSYVTDSLSKLPDAQLTKLQYGNKLAGLLSASGQSIVQKLLGITLHYQKTLSHLSDTFNRMSDDFKNAENTTDELSIEISNATNNIPYGIGEVDSKNNNSSTPSMPSSSGGKSVTPSDKGNDSGEGSSSSAAG